MPPKAATGAIPPTVKTLQSLLTRIGSASSGKKSYLIPRLTKDLRVPSRIPCNATATRVLSIDMGIKNLAFCVADVETRGTTLKDRDLDQSVNMRIHAWRKLNVAEEVERSNLHTPIAAANGEGKVDEEDIDEAYSPASLSRTAYTLLTKTLLPYKPDLILIERQRWRSAGGAAIQQWTVRVNTLEGMLWAILTALRAESSTTLSTSKTATKAAARTYEIFGVDPKRVGQFWIGGGGAQAETTNRDSAKDTTMIDAELENVSVPKPNSGQKLGRAKAEKKAKISLLRSWLTPPTPGTSAPSAHQNADPLGLWNPSIAFTFSKDAEKTREALCRTEKAKSGKRTDSAGTVELKKLDDVTDSFLQAAAWVAWEQNRVRIAKEWNEPGGRFHALFQDTDGDGTGKIVESSATQVKAKEGKSKAKKTKKVDKT